MTVRPSLDASAGFSLIELVVVVALAGILLRLAVPPLRGALADQRAKTVAYETMAALNLARSEAIKRNTSVTLTATTATAATSSCDGTQLWTLAVGGTTLQSWCVASSVSISAGFANVTFRVDGRASAATTITVCDNPASRRVKQRVITLDASGRPNLTLGAACGTAS